MPKIKANIVGTFYGYVNKEESEKKIIRDVFKKGDVYFNTGILFSSLKIINFNILYFPEYINTLLCRFTCNFTSRTEY